MSYTEETLDALLGIREVKALMGQASSMAEKAETLLTRGGKHALQPAFEFRRDQLRWAIMQTMLQLDKFREEADSLERAVRGASE